MPSDTGTTGGAAAPPAARDRVFLVVVDDSPERAVALKYACLRARKSGGRVALLRVIEAAEQIEWAGVGAMLQEEAMEEAERLLSGLAAQVNEITGGLPTLLIREGDPRDELLALIAEDPSISILVLAASAAGGGPGPLITALTGRYANRLTVPLTIVPGAMDDDALERVT
jgi:nucleotide-binding universal stress UspA family protein